MTRTASAIAPPDASERRASRPRRLAWLRALALGAAATAALLPLDPWIDARARGLRLGGDLLRELTAMQQYGQFALSIAVGAAVFLLDHVRRRRLLDWIAAALVAVLVTNLVSAMTGRPRPHLGDPYGFTGPIGVRVIGTGESQRTLSPWHGGYDLASLPSRHAAMAAVASCFLIALYPRLRPLALTLALIVGVGRVLTGAHWASDVAAGFALGVACAVPALDGYWGTRALDWVWLRCIDRDATPAYPALRAACGD